MEAKYAVILTLGVALIVGVVANGASFDTLTGQDNPNPQDDSNTDNEQPSISPADSATLNLAAYDQTADSQSQVSTTAYVWDTTGDTVTQTSQSLSASSRTSFSFSGLDTYKAIAFDSTYAYGEVIEGQITRASDSDNLPVYEAATGSEMTVSAVDGGSTVSSVTAGADQLVRLDGVQLDVASTDSFNPGVLMVGLADGTNVSEVSMPNAEKVEVPEAFKGTYDAAFEVSLSDSEGTYTASEGQPSIIGYTTASTGDLHLQMDSDGANGESVSLAFADYAPVLDQSGELSYGYQTAGSSPSDAGAANPSGTLTLQ